MPKPSTALPSPVILEPKTLDDVLRYAYAACKRWGLSCVEDVYQDALLEVCRQYHKYNPKRTKMGLQHFLRVRGSYAAKESAEREARRLQRVKQHTRTIRDREANLR